MATLKELETEKLAILEIGLIRRQGHECSAVTKYFVLQFLIYY